MASLEVLRVDGTPAGTVEIGDALVAAQIKLAAIRQCVNAHLSNRRQGTVMTKTRSMKRGGGAKPWRQKGTGRARAGSIRSPLWRGGGVAFGPQPRSYRKKVNKKARRAALRSVISDKHSSQRLTIVEALSVEEGKVKNLLESLSALNLVGKTLIVTERREPTVMRATANLPGINVQVVDSMNVYEILDHDNLVVTKAAIQRMEEMWA